MRRELGKFFSILLTIIMVLNAIPVISVAGSSNPSVQLGSTPTGAGFGVTVTYSGVTLDPTYGLKDGDKVYHLVSYSTVANKPTGHSMFTNGTLEWDNNRLGTSDEPAPTSANNLYIIEEPELSGVNYRDPEFINRQSPPNFQLTKDESKTYSCNLGKYHFEWTYSDSTGWNITVSDKLYTATLTFVTESDENEIDTNATMPSDANYYAVFSSRSSSYVGIYCIKQIGVINNGQYSINLTADDQFKYYDQTEDYDQTEEQEDNRIKNAPFATTPQFAIYRYDASDDKFTENYLKDPYNTGTKIGDKAIIGRYKVIEYTESPQNYAFSIKAQKQLMYEVEIKTNDGSAISGISGDFSVYAGVDKANNNGNVVRYYKNEPITINGITDQAYSFVSFDRSNDNPNNQSYASSDTVNVLLVRGITIEDNGDKRGNLTGGDIFEDGDVIGNYKIGVTTGENKTTYTFTKLPALRLKTQFVDEENETVSEPPTDYKLLIKMVRNSRTFYALKSVSGNATDTEDIVFKEYTEGKDGSSIGSENYYYSGSETISTQVVTGASALTTDLIEHKVAGAVFYNENTVGGTQNSDLTKDLYSTSSTIDKNADADNIKYLNTTFKKQSDSGKDHDITVSFYKEYKSDIAQAELQENTANLDSSAKYFFRVRLYNEGKLVAYKLVEVSADNITAANTNGVFTQTISGQNDTFKLVDDQGADIAGGSLHYDPAVYTSDVRFYKANDSGLNLNNVTLNTIENYATDEIDNFDFWFNHPNIWKDSSGNILENKDQNKDSIDKTGTEIALVNSTKKVYKLQVVFEDGLPSETIPEIFVKTIADHNTTGKQIYEHALIISGDTENGISVDGNTITYVIEDQTADTIIQRWTESGENLTISGNEKYTVSMKQDGKDLYDGFPIKIGDDYYTISTDMHNQDHNIDRQGSVTTITDIIKLKKTTFRGPAISPYDVLGFGAEFGVIANKYVQHDDTETNFAVNIYSNPKSIQLKFSEKNSAGDQAAPFYVGSIESGKLRLGTGMTTECDIYINPKDQSKVTQDNSALVVNIIPTAQTTINDTVNEMISKLKRSSSTYAAKPMVKAVGQTFDSTMFPDNITIYVDASGMDLNNDYKIKKLENQTIVFNIPGESVTIRGSSAGVVDVYRRNAETGALEVVKENIDTNTGGNGAYESDIENYILNHIVWNAYEAKTLEVRSGPAGLFLAPRDDAHVVERDGSGTGWIATAGTFDQFGSEWHFFRMQRRYSGSSTEQSANKKMKIDGGDEAAPSGVDQVFTFVRISLNFKTGEWEDEVKVSNTGSNISFPVVEYSKASDEGDHYFIIYEEPGDASDITYDTTKYVDKTTVTLSDDLTTCTVANHYYKLTDDAKTMLLSELTVHTTDESTGSPQNNSEEQTRYKIADDYLQEWNSPDVADVKFVNEKTTQQTGSITVNKQVKLNGTLDPDADNLPFYAGLFTKEDDVYTRVSGTDNLLITVNNGEGSNTFNNLQYGIYYVFEMTGENTADTDRVGEALGVYTVSGSGTEVNLQSATASVTITNNKELTQFSGMKTWYDEKNKTHDNAALLTLVLERTTAANPGENDWSGVTVNADTREKLTWTDDNYEYTFLDKYDESHHPYTYRARETAVTGNYVINQSVNNFVNTAYTSASKTKDFTGGWPDNTTVEFTLSATVNNEAYSLTDKQDAEGTALTLTQNTDKDHPTATWNKLKKYDENGNLITYTITETKVTIGTGNNAKKYTGTAITDRWEQTTGANGELVNTWKTTSVEGTKTWLSGTTTHNNSNDISLILKRTLKPVSDTSTWETVDVPEDGDITFGWDGNTYKFDHLPKYNNEGVEYEYKVEETVNLTGYASEQNGYNFINTELTSIEKTKQFGTGDKWPEGAVVEFTLSAATSDGTYSLTDAKDGDGNAVPLTKNATSTSRKVEWTKLRKYTAQNKEITYTITETKVTIGNEKYEGSAITDRWTQSTSGNTLINTDVTVDVTVSKVWADGDDTDKHPASITYTLRNDKDNTTQNATGLRDSNYAASFTGLRKYDDTGALIHYTVTEGSVPGYTLIATSHDAYAWTFTNKLGAAAQSLSATKSMKNGETLEEYGFTLTAMNGAPMPTKADNTGRETSPMTKKNDTNGAITFGTINFTVDDIPKTNETPNASTSFVYTIQENIPETATAANNYTVNGVKYDPSVYTATIVVTYNSTEGILSAAAPTYTKKADREEATTPASADNIAFVNELAGGFKITKQVQTDSTTLAVGNLANGKYYFNVYTDSNCSTLATKLDGSAIGTIEIEITDGTAVTAAVEDMAAGTYYVKEMPTDNRPDILLDTNKLPVTVTAGVKGADTTTAIVTFTNTYETTTVSGTKTWNDATGATHSALTIKLYQSSMNVTEHEYTDVTPTWNATFTEYSYENLPKKDNRGAVYSYRVEETVPAGYVMNQDGNNFTNTAITSISKTKAFTGGWPDDTTVEFTLSAKVGETPLTLTTDATGADLTLSKNATSDDKTVSWNNLKRYENGTEITYEVTETKVTIGTGANKQEFTGDAITDCWEQTTGTNGELVNTWKTTKRHARKTWAGDDADPSHRPASITYTLSAKDSDEADVNLNTYGITAEQTVQSSVTDYQANWDDLPMYTTAGKPITYDVTETAVEHYRQTGKVWDGDSMTWTFTNTWVDQPTFEKKIQDTNDSTGETSGWIDSADYDIGDPVPYLLKATLASNVTDYTEYHITFHDTLEKGLTFEEILRVTVGEKTLDTTGYVLTVAEDKHSFTLYIPFHYPSATEKITETTLNSAPVEVYFTAKLNEDAVIGGHGNVNTAYLEYSCNPDWDSSHGEKPDTENTKEDFVICFTYQADVNKVDEAGDALAGAEFKLEKKLKGGSLKTVDCAIASSGTTFSFTGLDDGEYVLTETKVPAGYTGMKPVTFQVTAEHGVEWIDLSKRDDVLTKLTGDVPTGELTFTADTGAGSLTADVTNESITTMAAVKKVWDDDNNRDGIRPVSLTVKLMKTVDGVMEESGKRVTLTTANNWIAMLKNLPTYENGKEITYSWQEEKVAGYTLSGTATNGVLTTLTNKHDTEKTSVSVRKVWDDNGNKAGKRPGEITVQLYADGRAQGKAVTLNSGNGWKYTWTDLDKNSNATGSAGGSKTIAYTVEELKVPAGYKAKITGNATTGFVITNTLEQGKLVIRKTFDVETPKPVETPEDEYAEVTVTKIWDDNDDRDGNRPKSVTVRLYAGGEEISSVQLSEANGWTHTFMGLQKWDKGRRIHYSVKEDPVEMYTAEIHGYTIKNTYRPETVNVSVRKIWYDEGTNEVFRPSSIRMTLSNGQSVLLSARNGWQATITGLPKKVNGEEVEYTWTEQAIPGYKQIGQRKTGNVTTFANQYIGIPELPETMKKSKVPGGVFAIFGEYDTALGLDIIINHVGDCFD